MKSTGESPSHPGKSTGRTAGGNCAVVKRGEEQTRQKESRRGGAQLLLNVLALAFGCLKLIWADGGYAGKLVGRLTGIVRHRKVNLEIVKRSDDINGLKDLPKRWIVERTSGWLIQSRWIVPDYEVAGEHSEAMIYPSQSKRMLARIGG